MKNYKPKKLLADQLSLKNKKIIITGAGGFLGLHFAEAVAEFGAIPIMIDVDAKKLNKNYTKIRKKFKSYSFVCDLSDEKNTLKLLKSIIIKFKKIDVLINALNFKGVDSGFYDEFENYKLDYWNEGINKNLNSVFIITKFIGKNMAKYKKGSIINISSDVGVISPDHRIYKPNKKNKYQGVNFNTPASYSVSKSGLISLTRYLSTYWAKKGVRVNSISPAGVFNHQPKKFINELKNLIPLGRMAFPEELKGPIVFLSSDASSFITGSNLMVDGGRTIW